MNEYVIEIGDTNTRCYVYINVEGIHKEDWKIKKVCRVSDIEGKIMMTEGGRFDLDAKRWINFRFERRKG